MIEERKQPIFLENHQKIQKNYDQAREDVLTPQDISFLESQLHEYNKEIIASMPYNFSLLTSIFIIGSVYTITLLSSWLFLTVIHISNLLLNAFIVDLIATLIVYFFSAFFQNSSLYDPYWGITNMGIAWYWYLKSSFHQLATTLGIILITVYCVRHLYLFFRNWAGLASEDFRYVNIKNSLKLNQMGLYWLISLIAFHYLPTFISFTALIPLYYIFYTEHVYNMIILISGFVIGCIGILIETISDEQLRSIRRRNKSLLVQYGFWKYSRHPNYFGECIFWIGLYVMALGCGLNHWWTGIGMVVFWCLIYFISIPMMENHLVTNKQGYDDYQRCVSKLIPWRRQPEPLVFA